MYLDRDAYKNCLYKNQTASKIACKYSVFTLNVWIHMIVQTVEPFQKGGKNNID